MGSDSLLGLDCVALLCCSSGDTVMVIVWELGLLDLLSSHSSFLVPVGYPAVLCGEAPHGHQHSHPSSLRQVPGRWLWVSLSAAPSWPAVLMAHVSDRPQEKTGGWHRLNMHVRKEGRDKPLGFRVFPPWFGGENGTGRQKGNGVLELPSDSGKRKRSR